MRSIGRDEPLLPALPKRHDERSARILAHTIYLALRARGYTPHQLLTLASELVGSVTREARGEDR